MRKYPLFKRDPNKKPGLYLQERDIKIIKLVYENRFLDSEQISLLTDSNHRSITRRLQKLFHWSFLDRPRSQIANYIFGGRKMIYALGDKGADILAERFEIDRKKINWSKKNAEVKERHLNHTMMISNFRTCLTLALKDKKETKLKFWKREEEMEEIKNQVEISDNKGFKKRVSILPDGFFCLEDKGDEMYFVLEADQSTMTNENFLKKMRAYWQWWKQGGQRKWGIESFRVLTICKSEERKENLRKITKQADDKKIGSLMFWFTSEKNYNLQEPEKILKPIWQTPRDDKFHSILD
jgi:predicted transcriptional regulator